MTACPIDGRLPVREGSAVTPRRFLASAVLAAALVSAGTGVASAAPPHSVTDATSQAQAHDGDPNAGLPHMDGAIVIGDNRDAAAGLVEFGVSIVCVVGLIMVF